MSLKFFLSDKCEAVKVINRTEVKYIANQLDDCKTVEITWKDNSKTEIKFGSFEDVKEFIASLVDEV